MNLIEAASRALSELKRLHELREGDCSHPESCPAACAIADLEKAITEEINRGNTAAPVTVDVHHRPDAHDVANAVLAASNPARFMHSTRICVNCERPLPPEAAPTVNRCFICPE